MLYIDALAYNNRLRYLNVAEKAFFALGNLFLGLVLRSLVVSLVIVGVTSILVTAGAGISLRVWLRLMALPAFFLLAGVVSVAVSLGNGDVGFLYQLRLGPAVFAVYPADLAAAGNLFVTSLGAVSCLYFLSLTTPLLEVLGLLRRLRVPEVLLDLAGLTYRFIFVFIETAAQIEASQASRLGYAGIKRAYHSLAQLVGVLFIRSLTKCRSLHSGLLSRCYEGKLAVPEPVNPPKILHLALILLGDGLMIVLARLAGGWQIG